MKIRNLSLSKKVISNYLFVALFALLCNFNVNAQKTTVQGTVTDATDGSPIPGVTILIEGSANGTTTDFDGNYSIKANIGKSLIFNYVGMTTQKVKITGKIVNVKLSSQVEDLDEVVVIGYGSVKKKEVTGAVSKVKAEALEKVNSPDLGTILQGQAAGVNVISASEPGGDTEILIRGVTSMGDNTPLYVVDGIIQEGDPRIAPSDIETIDILKDAASTAIYGSRGATGVILITTKQGTPGSLKVRTNASYSIQHRNAAHPLMNSIEQSYFDIVTQRNTVGAFDDDVVLRMSTSPVNFQNETDLNKVLFSNNVPTQNYNANISGGTKDITYNVSLGYFNQKGLLLNSAFDRFNTRANTVYNKGNLRLQTSVGMTIENRDIPQNFLINQAIRYLPSQNPIEPEADEDLESLGGDNQNRLNWILNSLKTSQERKSVRTFASMRIDYNITKDLKFNGNAGINTTSTYQKRFVPYTKVTNLQNGEVSEPTNSSIRMDASYGTSFYSDFGLTYSKTIDEDHNFTGTAYFSYEQQTYDNFFALRTGVTSSDIKVLNSAVLDADVGNNNIYKNRLMGFLGRFQYDYKGKYLLSSSFRRDGSTKFGAGKKWGLFPSISVGWNVSDEDFWSPLKGRINNFKLRASRGTVGNQRIQPYEYSSGIDQNINYVATGDDGTESIATGATQINFANANIQWETKTETNIGLDLGLFRNKLTITAEYYDISNKDMLFPVILPTSTGAGINGNVTLNVGNMTNKGAELAIGYRGRTGKVNWRMNGTFSTNNNKITKINGQSSFLFTSDYGLVNGATSQSQVTALSVGHEAGAFFLLKTDGILDTQEKLDEYQLLDSNAKMGDVRYVNSNGDDKISTEDRVYSGSGLPEYEIGYRFNANYKSFDFSMNWYAAIGQEIMNGGKANAYAYGRHKDLIYQWSPQNTETTIPAFRGDLKKHTNFLGYNDLWLEDGSYLRLRAVTLGYSLPQKTIQNMGITRLRFYVSAQNPFTFTNYSGYNPEVGGGVTARGLDKGVGPVSSQYLIGVNFNF